MPSEEKWYALTGRIVDAKVEADGDIHIALEDATGNSVGTVSAVTRDGWRWIVDAHRDDGRRYIVHSDDLLSAFLELEAMLL